jgi:uncharacterized protein YdiU (UPF0061 family)
MMDKKIGLIFDNSYLALPSCFYTRLYPAPVSSPMLVMFNKPLADKLGIDYAHLSQAETAAILSGNSRLSKASYFAQAYAGHQYGHFTMLGDGRAIVLGEHITAHGKRFDVQLKGSGPTPYSRCGDGRAALGPMLREYIISEAMHALDVPTTRSLAVVKTGESIRRADVLQGAILTRIAQSHIRVGTFEFAAAQKNSAAVVSLLKYTIERHYPSLMHASNQALALLNAVIEKQVHLIVQWMRVGFIHGVMNTDNMTISGETIDYGPCAFMDAYNPHTVFSSIDRDGRYAYANQPTIAQWNLARLAETLLPLINPDVDIAVALAEKAVNAFSVMYQQKWLAMMRAKLGLFGEQAGDVQLIDDLLQWMQINHADYTNTFLALAQPEKPIGDLYDSQKFARWYQSWQARLAQNDQPVDDAYRLMQSVNPVVIPRNHQVEKALAAANEGDMTPFNRLLDVLEKPYQNSVKFKTYQQPPSPEEGVYQTFCGT